MAQSKSKKHVLLYLAALITSSILLTISLIFNIWTIPLMKQQVELNREIKKIKLNNSKLELKIIEKTRYESIENYSLNNNLSRPKNITFIRN